MGSGEPLYDLLVSFCQADGILQLRREPLTGMGGETRDELEGRPPLILLQ